MLWVVRLQKMLTKGGSRAPQDPPGYALVLDLSCWIGKAVRNYSAVYENGNFWELNFTQFVNCNVAILGRRLCSPRLKDIGSFSIHLLVKVFPRTAATQPDLQTNVSKIKDINWPSSSQATFLNSQIVWNSILQKLVCFRIPIEVLWFLTALLTR